MGYIMPSQPYRDTWFSVWTGAQSDASPWVTFRFSTWPYRE